MNWISKVYYLKSRQIFAQPFSRQNHDSIKISFSALALVFQYRLFLKKYNPYGQYYMLVWGLRFRFCQYLIKIALQDFRRLVLVLNSNHNYLQ